MRILYCNKYNFPFSGTEIYLFEMMRIMRERQHEVALFSMQDQRGAPTEYDDFFVPQINFLQPGGGLLKRVALAGHAIYSLEARRRLRQLISVFKPDVAHVRNIYHHLSPSILWELKRRGVKVLYHLNDFKLLCPAYNMVAHGATCERCHGGRFRHVVTSGCYHGSRSAAAVLAAEAYVHRWLGTYQKCVDQFLAPSHFVKQQLVENGFEAGKINALPHFQRLPAYDLAPPPSDGPLLYLGRLSPEKGVDDLLRAMAGFANLRLQIAGEGPERRRLESLVQQLRLTNVSFLGHVAATELEQRIAAARFTVFPSRAYETLGKTILESYACGRAVIASDLGSRREFVHHGKTGLLFPSGDIEQLKSAIRYLTEHPQIAAEMGKAGRNIVELHHSPEGHYRAITGLYEQMLQGRSPWKTRSTRPEEPCFRIAFIGGRGVVSRYSGIEMYYEEAGRRLAQNGHEVAVYCRNYFTPAITQHAGMKVLRLPTIRSKHMETLVHSFLSTMHALFTHAEIVHYHAQGSAIFSFLPRLFGKKTIVTIQGLDWKRKKWGKVASTFLLMAERAALRFPNATVVVSKRLEQHYREQHAANTLYVPNGTEIRHSRNQDLVRKWGLEPKNYILYLGRLSPEKNCHLLIQAYNQIKTDAKLVFAGGSSYCDSYIAKLRRHESANIRFLEWVAGEDFNELLTNAMLFVLPSDLEGLSLALLDAMGAGVCVLASDIPENCEVVQGAGFAFRAGDVDDLARMLWLLISNPEIREHAAASARKRVREKYLWDGISKQMEQVYARVLGESPRASTRKLPAAPTEKKAA